MQKSHHENIALALEQDFVEPSCETGDSYEKLARRIKEMERNLTIRIGAIAFASVVYFCLLSFLYRT